MNPDKLFFTVLACVLLLTPSLTAQTTFNKDKDLLLAQYDLKPDEDDVMSAAALGCLLLHEDWKDISYYAVAGSYGNQGGKFIENVTPGLFNLLFGTENEYWTDAHKNWNASVLRVQDKVKSTLEKDGNVFICEGGQSNFSSAVLVA